MDRDIGKVYSYPWLMQTTYLNVDSMGIVITVPQPLISVLRKYTNLLGTY